MSELISVVVPIYNVEQYLPKCIESIIQQTYKNLEIILVNDGSTDNSLEICRKYKEIDSRIILIDKKNGGLSSARNAGLKVAKGQYIGFVDSDDWIDKDMYENLLKNLLKYNADIAECNYRFIYKNYVEEQLNNFLLCSNYEALDNFLSNYKNFKPVVWNKLYKRDIFNKVDFKEGYIHEDSFFTYKALYNANKIVHTGKCKYNYLQLREGSIMNTGFNSKTLVILEAFQERTQFFINHNLDDLAKKSLYEYYATLIRFYYNCRITNSDKDVLNQIQQKISEEIDFIFGNVDQTSIKIKYLLYKIHPNLFYYAEKCKDKVKKKICV